MATTPREMGCNESPFGCCAGGQKRAINGSLIIDADRPYCVPSDAVYEHEKGNSPSGVVQQPAPACGTEVSQHNVAMPLSATTRTIRTLASKHSMARAGTRLGIRRVPGSQILVFVITVSLVLRTAAMSFGMSMFDLKKSLQPTLVLIFVRPGGFACDVVCPVLTLSPLLFAQFVTRCRHRRQAHYSVP